MGKVNQTATVDSLDEFLANVSEDGTHECVVDKVNKSTSQQNGRSWIVFVYAVVDPNNDLDGEEFQEFFEDFSHVTIDEYKEMIGADKRKVRDAKTNLRKRLLSLGLSEDEVSGFNKYENLYGKNVNITVETSVNSTGKKFVNIRNVELV